MSVELPFSTREQPWLEDKDNPLTIFANFIYTDSSDSISRHRVSRILAFDNDNTGINFISNCAASRLIIFDDKSVISINKEELLILQAAKRAFHPQASYPTVLKQLQVLFNSPALTRHIGEEIESGFQNKIMRIHLSIPEDPWWFDQVAFQTTRRTIV